VHSIGSSSGGSASGGAAAPEADLQRFFVAEMDQTVHEAFEKALAKLKSSQLVSTAGPFKASAKDEDGIRSFTESLTLLFCLIVFRVLEMSVCCADWWLARMVTLRSLPNSACLI